MADSIGRADYELGATLDKLRGAIAEAEKTIAESGAKAEATYAEAGKRSGKAFSGALSTGIKALGAAGALVFGIATKGAIELANVAADFRAETGATADEADRAGHAINEMSGRNVQGIKDIGAALTKVHTDLGLTGEAAEKTTERFLRYARVTKQDAAGAVLAFDDVLDAWGLTVADAPGLMDKLIVSHQRYGGSITANQDALARLAPQMRALGATTDDTIALLNLFAASGLDASAAQRGLNTAVQQLPKGTTLPAFVAHLAAIKDPAERAAEATKVFGAMAGVKLSNAMANATQGLDGFKVSTQDATGAVDKANEALDSTFSAQIQAKVRAVGAAIRGIGADWGPLLTGAASVTSLLGVFDINIATALKGAWARVAVNPAVLAAAGVAGEAEGAAAAGGASTGLIAGVAAQAGVIASGIGAAIAASLIAAVSAGALALALGLAISKLIKDASGQSEAEWQSTVASSYQRLGGAAVTGMTQGVTTASGALDAATSTLVGNFGRTTNVGLQKAATDAMHKLASTIADGAPEAYARSRAAAASVMRGMRDAIIAGKSALVTAWTTALGERNRAADIADQILINKAGIAAAKKTAGDKTKTAAERAQARITLRALQAANTALMAEQANYGTRAVQIAKTKALLTSKALLKGLKDKDPDVRQHWKDVKEAAEAQLKKLEGEAKGYGAGFTSNFIAGLVKDIDRVGTSAGLVSQAVKDHLQLRSPSKKGPFSELGGPEGWGARSVKLYAKGMRSAISDVMTSSSAIASAALMTRSSATAVGMMSVAGASGSITLGGTARLELSLTPDAAAALRSAGYDERGVASALTDAAGLFTGLRQLRAMTSG